MRRRAGGAHAQAQSGVVDQAGERPRPGPPGRSSGTSRPVTPSATASGLPATAGGDDRFGAAHGVEHADVEAVGRAADRGHGQDVAQVVVDADLGLGHAAHPAQLVVHAERVRQLLPGGLVVAVADHDGRRSGGAPQRRLGQGADQDVEAFFGHHAPHAEHDHARRRRCCQRARAGPRCPSGRDAARRGRCRR